MKFSKILFKKKCILPTSLSKNICVRKLPFSQKIYLRITGSFSFFSCLIS